jgi:hypothetical protein
VDQDHQEVELVYQEELGGGGTGAQYPPTCRSWSTAGTTNTGGGGGGGGKGGAGGAGGSGIVVIRYKYQ